MADIQNIYSKIQQVRYALNQLEIKKSGRNPFSKFDYFQLQDFLPAVDELFVKHGLFSNITFDNNEAVLTIFNTEKIEEKIETKMPFVISKTAGMTDVQSIGASVTYYRRYLFLNLLNISSDDEIDAQPPSPKKETKKEGVHKISEKQSKYLQQLIQKVSTLTGKNKEEIKTFFKISDIDSLSSEAAKQIIEKLIELEKKSKTN